MQFNNDNEFTGFDDLSSSRHRVVTRPEAELLLARANELGSVHGFMPARCDKPDGTYLMGCDFLVEGNCPIDGSEWNDVVHLSLVFPSQGDLVKVILHADDLESLAAAQAALLPSVLTVESLLATTKQEVPKIDIEALTARVCSVSRVRGCTHGRCHPPLKRLRRTLGIRALRAVSRERQIFAHHLAAAPTPQHRALVVREQLNHQRCRLLIDPTSTSMWIYQYSLWSDKYLGSLLALPALTMATDEQLELVDAALEDLAVRPVGLRKNAAVRRVGLTTASRVLALLLPHLAVSWNDDRRLELGHGQLQEASFASHLQDVREIALCLEAQTPKGENVAGTLGCPDRETAWVIEAANMLDFPLW